MCTRKDSTLERRIRLNFPGVIIGVVDVGGGVAISLLLSLSLRIIIKYTSLLLLNIYVRVCIITLSACVMCDCYACVLSSLLRERKRVAKNKSNLID